MERVDVRHDYPGLQEITESIWRFDKQRFYGEAVGVYAIRDSDTLTIIDTPHFTDSARRTVESFNLPVKIFLTHGSASEDGDLWQEMCDIPLHLNAQDQNHAWLRSSPRVLFEGDQQITPHLTGIHLPGHSPGHMVYYDSRDGGTLFSGDAVLLHKGKLEVEITKTAKARLLELNYERLLPFHYDMIREGAGDFVKRNLLG